VSPVTAPTVMDLSAIRRRLAGQQGRALWRSLEELAGTDAFAELVAQDLPRHAAGLLSAVDRRTFLRLMGASFALAGLGACTKQPTEYVAPYVRQPEQLVLGQPLFFATAMSLGGFATGVLVESHEGRPTKIEGNPDHPASLGGTDAVTQASILGLYDPDRSQVVTYAGTIRPWSAFQAAAGEALAAQKARGGAGLRLLTETVTSPTLARQVRELLAAFPQARWHQWEPVGRDGARLGARLAFGQFVDTSYRFDRADIVLTLDADFLACGPGSARYARDFARRRRLGSDNPVVSRLYALESMPTLAGARADHRLAVRARDVEPVARAIAAAIGVRLRGNAAPATREQAAWIAAAAHDLRAHRGASLVIPGDEQPPSVHALAHAMNDALGNVGRTVLHIEPVEAEPVEQGASLRALADDMEAGRAEILVIVGGNPVFTAPVDLHFGERLARVPLRIHLGLYDDETAALCHWHVPEAHWLESWSDVRAFDGTVTIQQPLIAPLYAGRSAHEVLAALTDHPALTGHDAVRETWTKRWGNADVDARWRKALDTGLVAGTAAAPRAVTLRPDWDARPPKPARGTDLELIFRPDPTVWDGRFANNGWLQELPKTITRLTWDNAALMAPATAERLGLGNEEVVELGYRGRSVRAPVWIVPGHAADCVTIHLGYGRERAGQVGERAGFNAYALRTADAPGFGDGLTVRPTDERWPLAVTQGHHTMDGRPLVRFGTLEEYRRDPAFAREQVEEPPRDFTLYPGHEYRGHAWGMAIDLNACIGCNACVVACQAENNVPVVGKSEVRRGHEMHWLRVDRYYVGDLDAPETVHQPVPCMHCENAPCEVVCPVNATVHSSEGLNDQVYNRCVGTRYCSNNCPYKVRRFNFFLYGDWTTESLKMARNPDVTVRSRGVMEKCTYCVQRIERSRIRAHDEGRRIRDGEVVPACAQTCPAEAIVFGDVNDPASRVAKLKAEARSYALLGELNTRPRTTYLAGVRNPNPDIEG
jgi:MoCo/4Fe-4S cofactor protein with predicted Tat translocation signal